MTRATRIGVLAVQGDFAEHLAVLRTIGADGVEIRMPADLAGAGNKPACS